MAPARLIPAIPLGLGLTRDQSSAGDTNLVPHRRPQARTLIHKATNQNLWGGGGWEGGGV